MNVYAALIAGKFCQVNALLRRGKSMGEFPDIKVIQAVFQDEQIPTYTHLLSQLNRLAAAKFRQQGHFTHDLVKYSEALIKSLPVHWSLNFVNKLEGRFPVRPVVLHMMQYGMKKRVDDLSFYQTLITKAETFQEAHYFPFALLDILKPSEHHAAVRLFLSASRSVNEMLSHTRPAIFYAISTNDAQLLDMYIQRGASLDVRDEKGRTVVMYAALCAGADVMKCLCYRDAPLALMDDFGRTAAYYCVKADNGEALAVLMAAKLRVSAREIVAGTDPLICALQEGKSELFCGMIKHTNYNKYFIRCGGQGSPQWSNDWSPTVSVVRYWQSKLFLQAIKNGDTAAMWLLMRTGLDPAAIESEEPSLNGDWSYLMVAARSGQYESARLILLAGGNPYYCNSEGLTAFDVCTDESVLHLMRTVGSRYAVSAEPDITPFDEMDVESADW